MTDDKIHSIWVDHMGMGFLDTPMLFARDIIAQARAELIAEMRAAVADKPMERAVIERFIPNQERT